MSHARIDDGRVSPVRVVRNYDCFLLLLIRPTFASPYRSNRYFDACVHVRKTQRHTVVCLVCHSTAVAAFRLPYATRTVSLLALEISNL